ncbi:MAG TPA: ammonium transporter [Candidatus Thermoplasmatota archaeon]|nr:ammonium transporter [Candidatus Thermoplasmatota archaeon]
MHVCRTLARSAPILAFLAVPSVVAQDAAASTSTLSAGDTAWLLTASALVMLMVPGLALFYGGMVRHKNILSTLLQCFLILALVSIQFAVIGYTLAFGPDVGGIIGGLDFAFLHGIGPNDAAPLAPAVPHLAFILFQAMFAAITPALIIGAFVERFSFKAVLVFTLLWATLVYDPVAHSVWGGGRLAQMGALDFAGGTVVHLTAGVAALACALYVGRRKGFGTTPMPPNNIPLTVLGAGLLWFGWFGFNAGSAIAAGGLAAVAFATTHLAAAGALLSWCGTEWLAKGKPTAIGAASGVVAGLVAITPASGFVTPMAAILVGLAVGPLCYGAVVLVKHLLKLDDSLDAFGVHGVGGAFGSIATGLFATPFINGLARTGLLATPDGALGFTAGGLDLLADQTIAVAAVAAYTLVATFALLWVTDTLIGLRVPAEAEQVGLDLYEHGETAYHQADLPAAVPAKVVRYPIERTGPN